MLLTAVFLCLPVFVQSLESQLENCELIKIPQCKAMPYNMTQFPNWLKHKNQDQVKKYLKDKDYEGFIKTNCSNLLTFYMCARILPICMSNVDLSSPIIPPCKSVCLKVQSDCMSTIKSLNETWPEEHDCNKLPEYEKDVCIAPIAFVNASVEGKVESKSPCHMKCKTQKPAKLTTFDYAIKARLKKITINSDGSQTLVVKEVLNILNPRKTNKCILKTILWRASCRCLMPSINLNYLFAGNLDAISNQMVLQENGRLQPWNTKFLDDYQVKVRAYRRYSRKAKQKCSQRKNRQKTK